MKTYVTNNARKPSKSREVNSSVVNDITSEVVLQLYPDVGKESNEGRNVVLQNFEMDNARWQVE